MCVRDYSYIYMHSLCPSSLVPSVPAVNHCVNRERSACCSEVATGEGKRGEERRGGDEERWRGVKHVDRERIRTEENRREEVKRE